MDNSCSCREGGHSQPADERARAELAEASQEQFSLRLQRVTGQAVKPDQFGKVASASRA